MSIALTTAEYGLLGAAIISNGRILEHLEFDPSDFRDPGMEEVWHTVSRLRDNGAPIDQTTVSARLRPEVLAANPSLLQDSIDQAPDATTAAYYAHIVTEQGTRRKLDAAGRAITHLATQNGNVEDIIELAYKALDKKTASYTSGKVELETLADGMQETIDSLDQKPTFIETPWSDMNHIMQGWTPGRLYVVGARPSVGKTVFGVQAALALTNMGPVAYTSLEMSAMELRKRAISHIARVGMSDIQKHEINNRHRELIANARHELDNGKLYIDPSPEQTLWQVIRHARYIHRRHGLAAVVVDYIGRLDTLPGKDERETITEASKRLQQLAEELNVPVIVLSQLNRGIEGRDNKEPRLSDLRMSGSLEQDADVVILLHRDLREAPHEMHMNVAKNRHGITGDMTLEFAGYYSEIRNQPATGGL